MMAGDIAPEAVRGNEPERLNSQDWDVLLRRIKVQKCTPVLGSGVYVETLPLSLRIARDWAAKYPEYPFEDCFEISRVAQFLSVKFDATDPKDRIVEQLRQLPPPDFDNPNEPHGILSKLPLPVYITTNYDDSMVQALRHNLRDAKLDFCRWNKACQRAKPPDFPPDYEPTVANPLVFHFHGYLGLSDSLVLTDDDYLDFLVSTSRDEKLIPPHVEKALTGTSLMLLGYRLEDWNFRVLFRSIVNYLEKSLIKTHVSVQLEPVGEHASAEQKERARNYFNRYFNRHDVRVYWGTCQDFVVELNRRWEESGE
jgi:SIR2-like domain